jgi:hypothetical protein
MLSDKWQDCQHASYVTACECGDRKCVFIVLNGHFYHNHTKDASDVQFSMVIKDAARALVSTI